MNATIFVSCQAHSWVTVCFSVILSLWRCAKVISPKAKTKNQYTLSLINLTWYCAISSFTIPLQNNIISWYIKIKLFCCCPLKKCIVQYTEHPIFAQGSILWNKAPWECTVKYCPPRERILKINSSSITLPWRTIQKLIIRILQHYIISVLGLKLEFKVKYSPLPSGVSLGNSLRQRAIFDRILFVSS